VGIRAGGGGAYPILRALPARKALIPRSAAIRWDAAPSQESDERHPRTNFTTSPALDTGTLGRYRRRRSWRRRLWRRWRDWRQRTAGIRAGGDGAHPLLRRQHAVV
jgi:hypothetical protein